MEIVPKIIYEDSDVLVLNKPAGLLVHPTNGQKSETLVDWLVKRYPEIKDVGDNYCRDDPCGRLPCGRLKTGIKPVSTKTKFYRPGIVHRLDKDTSGLMIVAKNQKAYDWLKKQFQERKVVKKYLALVYGVVKPKTGTIIRSIGRSRRDFRKKGVADFLSGKRAKTRYQVLEYYSYGRGNSRLAPLEKSSEQSLNKLGTSSELYTLLEVQPETGRTHQIRVHLASIGHPIVGDRLYKFKRQKRLPGLKRQFLHAYYLKLKLPSGRTRSFKVELAKDLKRF